MPHADPVNWQSISKLPLIASMIDGALDDTRDHIETLTKAEEHNLFPLPRLQKLA